MNENMKFPFMKISCLCMKMRELCADTSFIENDNFAPAMISFALEIFVGKLGCSLFHAWNSHPYKSLCKIIILFEIK